MQDFTSHDLCDMTTKVEVRVKVDTEDARKFAKGNDTAVDEDSRMRVRFA